MWEMGKVSFCPFLPSHCMCVQLFSSMSCKSSVALSLCSNLTARCTLLPAACLLPMFFLQTVLLCLRHLAQGCHAHWQAVSPNHNLTGSTWLTEFMHQVRISFVPSAQAVRISSKIHRIQRGQIGVLFLPSPFTLVPFCQVHHLLLNLCL